MADPPPFLRNARRPGVLLHPWRLLEALSAASYELGEIFAAIAIVTRDHHFKEAAVRLDLASEVLRARPVRIAAVLEALRRPLNSDPDPDLKLPDR